MGVGLGVVLLGIRDAFEGGDARIFIYPHLNLEPSFLLNHFLDLPLLQLQVFHRLVPAALHAIVIVILLLIDIVEIEVDVPIDRLVIWSINYHFYWPLRV